MRIIEEQKFRHEERDPAWKRGVLAALRAIVGASHATDDPAGLRRYTRSTAARATLPLAVVRPASQAEVVALVRLAAQHGLPLYPLSTGRNWGYGDACAVGDAQLIVDLGRMNRIVEVDAELGYAVIEPGVTQQQLSDYLSDEQLDWWIDCTGAGPDTSFMGNILERGFGHSPYGNRLQHVSGMQVVLASGEMLATGFGHYARSRATHLFPYGVGPFLDGMFTQSNFGIVTRIGIWLQPAAECVNHFLCTVSEHEDIGPVVDALRPLRMNGTLRSIVHIGNDMRVISGGRVFPRSLAPDQSCLPSALRGALREAAGAGAWTVSGALYGSAAQVAAARMAIRAALRDTRARTAFLSERKLRWGGMLARLLGESRAGVRLRARVGMGEALFAMNRGKPNGRFLVGAYWRRREALPAGFPHKADPALDNCGMFWISPVLPMRGQDVLDLHALVEPLFAAHGFDLFVTFSMINERALGAVLTIAYDKEDAAEVVRARECYQAVFDSVMEAGYIPYRVGNQSMAALDPGGDVYWKTVAAIKAALDPAGLIAPGRYEPGRAKGLLAGGAG
ncbi:FAD-binding oxidoreductase [Massilia antarctica]|uniref:FAD-binding oxidoreductase n=1 Tax=Massilia antarctica TaxID=2765360 RepID=UPI0006BB8363|nr:FAD-binding oxidoreductase [Massilia sp. H27-R4]MCY0910150.1 FAD-binding oxidoreductase [Massilia sp. H27-R4]CUI02758.1 4-cresol dehydrogenase [hydroxylating] flavoprotein subunit [Janthinobacterium sp. CG23_2]CUU26544.1 4-cresol dehydrogenase [hydroxylating] flavoprotein subunit [Janthinobacterium sp. CG23_2]